MEKKTSITYHRKKGRAKWLLLGIAWIFGLCTQAACSDEKDESVSTTTLELSKETVDFSSEASEQTLTLTTNATDLSASSDQSWCQASINNKQLVLSVDESEERLVRSATVTIKADALQKTLTVRQLGYEAAILVDKTTLTADVTGGEVTVSVTTNVDITTDLPEWITEKAKTRAVEMVTTDHTYTVSANTADAQRTGTITFKEVLSADAGEEETAATATITVTQNGLDNYEETGLDGIEDDIKITVKSGKASSFQSGQDIDKSYDGDKETLYHSNWNNDGDDYFPITLTYNFEEGTDMDYFIYYPRTGSNSNGNFKEVEISVLSDANTRATEEWTTVMTKDFGGSSNATRVDFPTSQIGVKSVRFVVKSGAGDGQGFAACAEMEFYKKNPNAFDYSTLFTDLTCSELKAGVTDEDIENCTYSFYKNMAYYMKHGKYPSEFRIQEYKAYPNPDDERKANKTSYSYSLLDNPTGISVAANSQLIVFVGEMQGYTLTLRVQNLDQSGADGFGGDSYSLVSGINKLNITNKGLVYVMYHTADYATAPPVKIHFASGTVNGYFDVTKHEASDWTRLLANATDDYFDVLGEYAHLTFPTERFRSSTPDGKALIDAYDLLVKSEMELLGLYKYDRVFHNRMYLYVTYKSGSYMYATSNRTAYESSTLASLCDIDQLTATTLGASSCWGPAHEIGHCNQTKPGLKWLGTTEVTNNIMSEYVQTTVFNCQSRVQTEDMGDTYRNRYSKAWNTILVAGIPHADSDDEFCKLIPFWQLQLYFGKALGRTPLDQEDKGGFYPDVYEYIRTHDDLSTAGLQQTEFPYICSQVSGYDLTDFFTQWGFFTPVDKEMEDYTTGQMQVTQTRIDEVKARIKALNLPKPPVALEYITDLSWKLYKNPAAIVKGTVSISGNSISLRNWENVVTYEVVDSDGKLLFVCDGKLDETNNAWFNLPFSWQKDYKIRAVAANGDRVEATVQ